jgi:hypothetical protein
VELRQVVGVLPLSVEQAEPPSTLRDRVLTAAREDTPAITRPAVLAGATGLRKRAVWPRAVQPLLALAAAVALVALGLWNLNLRGQVNSQQHTLAYQQAIVAALASGASVSRLPGTAAMSGASAALVQPRGGKAAYLIIQGLPASARNRVYQAWLVRGATPVSAGVFTRHGAAPQIVQLNRPAVGFALAAVTEEPGPHGSHQPTGQKLVLGKLSV